MKSLASLRALRIFGLVGILLCTCAATSRANDVIYQSRFSQTTDGWTGRAGASHAAPQSSVNKEPPHNGEAVCSVETDGGIGSGLTMKPSVDCEPGIEYIISFSLKSTGTKPVTFRITRPPEDGEGEYGEDGKQWFPTQVQEGEWVDVERFFVASSPVIGVDIAVGADHDPAILSLCNVKIQKAGK